MSDSDSSSSKASNTKSSENEETTGAYGRQYMPYQNEPLVTSAENSSDEDDHMGLGDPAQDSDGIRPSQLRDRYDGRTTLNEWCNCSKCHTELLFSAREYRCCREVHPAFGKLVFHGTADTLACITQHEDYLAVVNKEVLLLTGPSLKGRDGKPYKRGAGVSENE